MNEIQSFEQNNLNSKLNPQKSIKDQLEDKTNSHVRRKAWSVAEDNALKEAIRKNSTNWVKVAESMENRNPSQCAQRWKRIKPIKVNYDDFQQTVRDFWTKKEDQQLLFYFSIFPRNWVKIARHIPKRTSKQVRERFMNKLNPDINQTPFSVEEDMIIVEGYKEHGSKWAKIGKQLVGRPENIIKNRFYSFIRKHYLNIENPYYVIQHKPTAEMTQQDYSVVPIAKRIKKYKKKKRLTLKQKREKLKTQREKLKAQREKNKLQDDNPKIEEENNNQYIRNLEDPPQSKLEEPQDKIVKEESKDQQIDANQLQQNIVKEEMQQNNQRPPQQNNESVIYHFPYPVIVQTNQNYKIIYFYPKINQESDSKILSSLQDAYNLQYEIPSSMMPMFPNFQENIKKPETQQP